VCKIGLKSNTDEVFSSDFLKSYADEMSNSGKKRSDKSFDANENLKQ
jgi:hypothetical protein